MIRAYIDAALARAEYEVLEDRSFRATVPGLRGVVALGPGVEACRRELAEVVEEWVLVRVARGLPVPKLGGVVIQVRRAG
jgi:predicted RNase H-like HicB family nuclease